MKGKKYENNLMKIIRIIKRIVILFLLRDKKEGLFTPDTRELKVEVPIL